MKPFQVLLACIIVMLLILIAAAISPIDGLTGIAHPKFDKMKVSPETVGMYTYTKWLSYALAMALIAMFISVLYIGSRRNGKGTGMMRWIIGFGVMYAILFSLTIFSNWEYVSSTENVFWGQMPKPTAWAIYALWLCPLILVFAYVFYFDRWVISKQDEEELLQWIKDNQE